MKTPIQELIDTFEEMNTGIDPSVDVRFALGLLRSKLEKEYNFIEQVYYDARDNEYEHHSYQYFNNMFRSICIDRYA